MVSLYAHRWAIEKAFRNLKQYLGTEDPQRWVKPDPREMALHAKLSDRHVPPPRGTVAGSAGGFIPPSPTRT